MHAVDGLSYSGTPLEPPLDLRSYVADALDWRNAFQSASEALKN
jgi:hypothetical protein